MEVQQQMCHRRLDEEGSTKLEVMGCEQIREGVVHRQENQGWQENEGKQPFCITNFNARVFSP